MFIPVKLESLVLQCLEVTCVRKILRGVREKRGKIVTLAAKSKDSGYAARQYECSMATNT